MHAATLDELQQKSEWRARLIVDLLSRKHDIEILGGMLEAGLRQAHSEGLADAAHICQAVAKEAGNASQRQVAEVLAKSIRELDRLNKAIEPGDYSAAGQA